MASRRMFLSLLISFIFVHARGQDQQACDRATSIIVEQESTGRTIGGQPEWLALIRSNCSCSQSNVMLYCPNFYSTEPINPGVILKLDDDRCRFLGGGAIPYGMMVTFRYANDVTSPFQLLFHDVLCSNAPVATSSLGLSDNHHQ